jgi:glycosyltransferase involved in cell wall biosynthesis
MFVRERTITGGTPCNIRPEWVVERHMMQQPRRILHVVHGYPPESRGGTEGYVQSLLGPQVALGLEPMVLHGSFEPRAQSVIEPRDDLGVPAFRLHRADAYSDYWDRSHYEAVGRLFDDLLARLRPDVVHVHQWIRLTDDLVERAESAGIATVVALHDVSASCPACFRLRPDESHCERIVSFASCHDCVPLRGGEAREEVELGIDIYRANFRHELQRARRVLAATRTTASLVTRGLELAPELVHLLPLAYERRFTGMQASSRAPGPLRLAYWGNVTRRKGVQVLLRALRSLAPLDDRLELHVFGSVDTDALRAEIDELVQGLPVTLHGRYEYEQLFTLQPDLAVFPSTCFETYGLVLDEAFELGVPALVTDVGAFAERLQGGGFLAEPGSPESLAAAIRTILDEPTLLAEHAARIPQPSPTPEQHVSDLLVHYREAMQSPPAPGEPTPLDQRSTLESLRANAPRDTAPLVRGL